MRGSSAERAPLLAAAGHSRSSHTLQRVAVALLILLSVATSLALVRVSLLSQEILDSLRRAPTSSSPSAPAAHYSATAFYAEPQHGTVAGVRVLIVYSNGTHLSKLASAVESGVLQTVATHEQLRTRLVSDASFVDDVLWADAVILGSHVVNANVEPQMATFLSHWDFSADLSHKVGAVFVTGGGISSGEELTMVNLLHSMLIFRMVVVGGERWTSAFGASAIVSEGPFQPQVQVNPKHQEFPANCYSSDPDQIHKMFKDKAEGLGRRVASVASALQAHK